MIAANLDEFSIDEGESEVVCSEASAFLRRLIQKEPGRLDVIFFDPPYAADYEVVLELLGDKEGALLAEGAIVVVEHHKKRELNEGFGELHRYRSLKQGDSCLSFYARKAA